MYSFSDLEPVCCSTSSSNCYFFTCIQIFQEAGKVVWCSHFLKNVPQFIVIHTVKGFGIVNKAEVDVFLELSCFVDDPADVGNLISGSSAFSKSSLNIWKFSVYVLLKPSLENFEHYLASVWDECNCVVVWTFFGIVFLWEWSENWPFPVLWPLLSFPNLLAYWVQHSPLARPLNLASPTQWTWVRVDSGSWWWTGRPGVLWLMRSQRVRHNWMTELN